MSEAFAWPDCNVYISTGVPFATSAIAALCENTTTNRQWGIVNTVAAGGVYYNHDTGQRCDVNIGMAYTIDHTLEKIAEGKTALHMKFVYSAANGSAGMFLWSGRIQSLQNVGQDKQIFKLQVAAFFNNWSAF